jgi:exosortase A
MTAILPIRSAEFVEAKGQGWRSHLVALACLGGAILFLFHRDSIGMVEVWLESETFNHCALILPIIFWLVWQRVPELRQLAPSAWPPGLALVGAGAIAWLVGEAGGIAVARHGGIILMLQGSVIACLGRDVSRALAFPIFYAIFLIPAGDELVAPMQTLTAKMCMILLGLVGLPAHIEGVFITTPTGYFEVAEACSGVQFLIAMLAYGALVANTCFRSWKRRLLFIAAAVAIPVLANGIRAWGTIYVAHLTTNEFAAGFDHVLYGWIFFALVIALLMAAGWPYFDRRVGETWFDPATIQPVKPGNSAVVPVAAAILLLAALPLAWTAAIAATVETAPSPLALPEVRGWTRVPATSGRPWEPHFAGADMIRFGRYRNAAGQEVDLAMALYAQQQEGRELIGFGQGAAGPDSGWAWAASGNAPASGRLDRIVSFGDVREVATFYRVGSIVTGSSTAVKLEMMKARLLGGPQRAVAVLVSAQAPAEGVSPRPAIDAFIRALGPIDRLADDAAGLPHR